jgi:sulfoquinovose isomerase
MTAWTSLPSHRRWLDAECGRLLRFGTQLPVPGGGAAWLRSDGTPDESAGTQTWITTRTLHVYSLGQLLGVPGANGVATAALAGLVGPLHDDPHGGWYSAVDSTGTPADGKSCYDHVFVVLAAASACFAGLDGAAALLAQSLETFDERFWDEAAGLCVDGWDTGWTQLDPYRGLNANMHAVEALLAASDATDDPQWRDRALRIATSVVGWARAAGWRIPEHFDDAWVPQLEYNHERPDDRFKPYGATVGHALEWSRLLLQLEAAVSAAGSAAPEWLAPAAEALFDRAVSDGWAVDGADGFVYTTDWAGAPVVRDRLHWVLAEGIGAAAALHQRTGNARYAELYATWWDFAADHLIDRASGSWHHQLDPANQPTETVWRGKPDLYHAVQATLIPRLPLAPGLAKALAHGLLEAANA